MFDQLLDVILRVLLILLGISVAVTFVLLVRFLAGYLVDKKRTKNSPPKTSLGSSLSLPAPNPIHPLERRFSYHELMVRRKQHLQRFLVARVNLDTSYFCATVRAYRDYRKWCEKQGVPEKERYRTTEGFSRVLANWGVRHGRKWIQDKQYRSLLNFELLPDPDERYEVYF